MYKVYYYRYRSHSFVDELVIPYGMSVAKCLPKARVPRMSKMQMGWKRFCYHYLYTFLCKGFMRTFVEYDYIKGETVVTKDVVESYVPMLKFMPRSGLHIGFAETIESERNQGYQTLLLKFILKDNVDRDLYMIVARDNFASIKSIEKAGFERYAQGELTDDGNYILTQD